MYKYKRPNRSLVKTDVLMEGETIEMKVRRILSNKEPIKDGAPEIFTDRKDGVQGAYNIRTDRWEVAAEAMDLVTKSKLAKREEKAKLTVIKPDKDDEVKLDGGAEPTQGQAQQTSTK